MKESTILIADAGGSTISWALVSPTSRRGDQIISTPGMNILMASAEGLDTLLTPVVNWASEICVREDLHIEELYFYGAGCSTSESSGLATSRLLSFFPNSRIHVESDMLGAARASLVNRRGIACILGTGSNSCLYDGNNIEQKVPSLGFILGDDGSGAALGRRLLRAVIQRRIPEYICDRFFKENNLSVESIINSIYRRPLPNRYMASFAPWILKNLYEEPVRTIVMEEFRDFMRFNILAYKDATYLPVAICGSIAENFAPLLMDVAAESDVRIISITANPIEGIIRFHKHTTISNTKI